MACFLFLGIYIADLPKTFSKKFNYVDYIALHANLRNSKTPKNPLKRFSANWMAVLIHRGLNKTLKTNQVVCFHINNKLANYAPTVKFRS